ncbi:hypothetical protein MARPO_3949s0001 [Marchantia polymorpha]|uniref:Uncharacterized protein n=1 Tax=Marchantia polymorpha TaxID=3197 RepID=A0A2R6VXC7_MARPO|nr:hypothetical protein MARPO_3949s0001 [Marchantia polymorpha]|eukprot:PTQ26252.1 hypothetical protein MARPO_3949s0001 [Marchantia polymorpha]
MISIRRLHGSSRRLQLSANRRYSLHVTISSVDSRAISMSDRRCQNHIRMLKQNLVISGVFDTHMTITPHE